MTRLGVFDRNGACLRIVASIFLVGGAVTNVTAGTDSRPDAVGRVPWPALMPQFTGEIAIPEGSRAAALFAIAEGFEWIDAPIQRTSDGVLFVGGPVVFDGRAVDPQTTTWSQVQRGTRGNQGSWRFLHEPFLSLEDFLDACTGSLSIRVRGKLEDLKTASEIVRRRRMPRVLFASEGDVARLRAALGNDAPIEMRWSGDGDAMERVMEEALPSVISLDPSTPGYADPTSDQVERWRARGIRFLLNATLDPLRPEATARLWEKTRIQPDIVWTNQELTYLGDLFRSKAKDRRVQICCHRGASRYAPENTLRAFQIASALGADYVEFDVRTTADGVPILMHDSTLDRMTKRRGRVCDTRWDDIKELIVGDGFHPGARETVPSLASFLATCDRSLKLYVDAKEIEPEALVVALKKHNRLSDAIVYQGAGYLRRLKEIEPEIKIMPPLDNPADLERLADDLHPYAVDVSWRILSKELITDSHARGIKVFSDALGLFEVSEQYRRVAAWGIDCIQTDQPLRVLRALIEQPRNQ